MQLWVQSLQVSGITAHTSRTTKTNVANFSTPLMAVILDFKMATLFRYCDMYLYSSGPYNFNSNGYFPIFMYNDHYNYHLNVYSKIYFIMLIWLSLWYSKWPPYRSEFCI